MSSILIVADIRLYREGLKMLLETDNRFAVIDSAASGSEAIDYLLEATPEAIVLDLAMEKGLETLQRVARVATGTPVMRLHDSFLETEAKIARAKLNELRTRYRAERVTNFVKAGIIKEAVTVAESELIHILDKINSMSVIAFKSGTILMPDADDLPGRFVRQGELLGYILNDDPPTIRMAVDQDNIGQLRKSIVEIKIKLASDPRSNYSAEIIRQAPEATNQLPSAALATTGGGKFIINPDSKDQLLALEKVFLVDLRFNPGQKYIPLGTRAYVRIDHGGEALALQWYRGIRQTFLRQFNV